MRPLIDFVSLKLISPFNWTRLKFLLTGKAYDLYPEDRDLLRRKCEEGVHIWVTRRDTHLTTYLIAIGDYLLGMWAFYKKRISTWPTFGYYSHAFCNADETDFIEAVAKGVLNSRFDAVFDVDAAAALVPAGLTDLEWKMFSKKFIEVAKQKIGNTKYDTVFNLADETEVSCIELIRVGLRHCMLETEYLQRFPHLEELIKVRKNLTPDMLRNCLDFKVVFEQRR